MITFTVIGTPKGQPRPKAFSRGGHAGVYDPGTAAAWKNAVAWAAKRFVPSQPLTCALALSIEFNLSRPKSHFRKNGQPKPTAPTWCMTKPDADNLAKAVMDALTDCGMWRDDAQIVILEISKRYDTVPSAKICIKEAV